MFSKNTYLLQQDSPSVVGLNGNEILLHHQDMLSSHYLPSNPPVVEAAVLYNQDVSVLNGDPSTIAPKTTKKDRHSKIYTSQGPRDRRVRLSIGVARKFFDLQEMLGFDKPSKTLDWLLTKSKTAIKHLVRTKNNNDGSKSVSSLSECEENERSSKVGDTKGKSVVTNANNKHKGTNLAKESRVKARARARERTREKMCIKHFNESNSRNTGGGYDFPIQYMNNQLEVCKISGNNVGILHCSPYEGASNQQDLIHEPVVTKRKAKHPSIFGFQPNYNIPSPYNATENWDISNILDQAHKFNNSSSNN